MRTIRNLIIGTALSSFFLLSCGTEKDNEHQITNEKDEPIMIHMIEELETKVANISLCSQFLVQPKEKIKSEKTAIIKKGYCSDFDSSFQYRCEYKAPLKKEETEREYFFSFKETFNLDDPKPLADNICDGFNAGSALDNMENNN